MNFNKLQTIFAFLILVFKYSYSQELNLYLKPDDNSTIQDAHIIIYKDSLYKIPFYSKAVESNRITFSVPDSLNCFYVFVSHINYYHVQKKFCRPFKSTDTINLYKKEFELNEVVIKGVKKTKLSVKGNVAEIRPGKIISKSRVNANTLIKSIPDIFVLPGDDIKIRGQNVNDFYIHAKTSSPGVKISKEDFLGIDASSIEKIVTLYNEREIHIYLKQNKLGYKIDVNLNLNKGKHFYSGLDPDFSFAKEKSVLWLNTDFGVQKQEQNTTSQYRSFVQDINFILNSESSNFSNAKFFKTSLLYEKDIDKKGIFGLRVRYKWKKNIMDTDVLSNTINTQNEALTSTKNSSDLYAASGYYKKKINDNWRIIIKTGYLYSTQKNNVNSVFNYDVDNSNSKGSQYLDQNNKSDVFTYEFNLKRKINDYTNLAFKVNQEIIKTNSSTSTYQKKINNTIPDSTFTNNIDGNTFYIKLNFKTKILKKILLDLSPEVVFNNQSYNDEALGELFNYNQKAFIPSFTLSYPVKETKYLTVFGNQTVKNVDLKNLVYNTLSYDGFVNKENNYALKPALYKQLGVAYPLIKNVNTSLYYTSGKNTIMSYPLFSENGVFLTNRTINLDKNNVLGISLFYSNSIGEKIYLSSSININNTKMEGEIETNKIQVSFTNVLFNQMLYYTISDSWTSYLDFTFMSKQKLSDVVGMKSVAYMNLGVTKKFKKYFELSLSIDDVFNSYTPRLYSLKDDIPYTANMNFDYRLISLSLNYTLNKKFKKRSKTKDVLKTIDKRILLETENKK